MFLLVFTYKSPTPDLQSQAAILQGLVSIIIFNYNAISILEFCIFLSNLSTLQKAEKSSMVDESMTYKALCRVLDSVFKVLSRDFATDCCINWLHDN